MILGRAVAAVATPARGPSVPGVGVRSGVIMWASSPLAATAAVAARGPARRRVDPDLDLGGPGVQPLPVAVGAAAAGTRGWWRRARRRPARPPARPTTRPWSRDRIQTVWSSVFGSGSGQEKPTNRALPTSTGADCSRVPAAGGVGAACTDPAPGSVPRSGSLADPERRAAALSTAAGGPWSAPGPG